MTKLLPNKVLTSLRKVMQQTPDTIAFVRRKPFEKIPTILMEILKFLF